MYANPFNSNDPNDGYSINNNSWNGDGPYSPFGMPMFAQWGGGGGGGGNGGGYTPPVLPNPVFVPPSYVVNNTFRVNLSSDNSCEFFENSKSVGIGLATTLNKTSLRFGDTKYEAVNNSKVTLNYFNVTIQKKNISVNTLPATTPNLLPISNGPWTGFFNGFGANTTSTNNGSSFFGGTLGTFNTIGSNNTNAIARTTSIFGNPFNLNFNVGPAPTVNDANFVEQISIKEYQLGTDGLTYTLLGEQKLNIGSTINLQFRFKERVIKKPPTDIEIKGDNPPKPPAPPKEVVNPNVQYEIAIGSNFESELGSNIKVSYKIVTKTGEVADGGSVLLANRNTNGKEISEDILKDCTVYFTIEGDIPTEYSYRGIYYNNIDVIKKQPARDSIDYTSWNKGDKVFTIPGSQLKGGVGIAVIFEKVITYNKPELTVATKQYNVEVKDSDTNKQVNILFESLYADYVDVYTSANQVIRVNATQRFANLFFKEDFKGLYGSNKITLVPFSEKYGTGDRTDILINFVAINDFPSVTQIVFPDLIDVPSFSDLNIDWEVHYNTFAVTSVDVYLLGKDKTSRTQLFGNLEPNGSFTINLRSLASRFPVWNGSDAVTLIFKPYNRSGTKELLGNEYEITTKVIYPEIQLDEDIIRSAIFDSFMAKLQFTEPEKESKYLTHLANFGEDEHILISTFEEDKWTLSDKVQDAFGNTLVSNEVSSLILKLYSPLPDTYTENSTLWITKLMTNPLVETIILNEQDNLECPPIKGPNFNIDVDYTKSQSTNYQSFDELILSSSVSTVSDNIVAYLSSSINGTEDLNIEYASGSIANQTATYLWDNFVHFSSAEDRVDNFIYKVQLIERYDELIVKAQTGVSANSISATNEIARQTAKKNTLINGFDGFEKFLWEYSDKYSYNSYISLTWPWQVGEPANVSPEYIISITNSTEWRITIDNGSGELATSLQTGDRIAIVLDTNIGPNSDFYYVKRINSTNFLVYHDAALKRPVDSRGFSIDTFTYQVFKVYEDSRFKSDTSTVQTWYNNLIEYAAAYDINNQNYILNNIPQYILTNTENENLLLFFSMIGQYFDSLYYYTKALERSRGFGYKSTGGVADKLLFDLLKTFSWDAKNLGVDAEIWEYIYGADSEGDQRVDTPSKKRTKDVWRRILNNIPHLLKHKGTKRGVYALMACYGIPASNLSIIEFGGPETSIESKGKLVMDNATNVVLLDATGSIKVPWTNTQLNRKPDTIEIFLKPAVVKASNSNRWTVISGSNWDVQLSGSAGSSYGKVLFTYSGSNQLTSSLLPIFNDRFFGISVSKNYSTPGSASLQLDIKQANVNRTVFSASYSTMVKTGSLAMESGSFVSIGSGSYKFSGSVDEFRMWSTPLSASKFFEHCSYPEMINGNHISSSTEDLYFRLDFEYPKDLAVYTKFINIAPSVYYSGSLRRNDYELGNTSRLYSLNTSASFSASAINFTTKPTYPHSFEDIERTIVLEVPDLGVSRYATDKIRFEEQELSSDLSSKHRSTVKSFDHAPVDSNRIGIFFSPTKELNFDIAKSFGSENLDNYIGDPSDKYAETYKDLNQLRTYYFKRIHNRNIYEYIDLIKVYEKAMFDDIKKMLPARSKPATGLLIEPHILERSKVKQNKPSGVNDQIETIVDAEKNTVVTSDIEQYETIVTHEATILGENEQYESIIDADLSENIFSEAYQYDSVIGTNDDINLSSELVGVETDVDCQLYKPTVVSSIDLFENTTTVGQTAYEDVGFGLYAENGHAIRTYFNKDNRLIKERVAVSLVTEMKSFTTYKYRYILPNGKGDGRGGLIQTSSIYYERSLNVQSYSGSVLPTFPIVSGNTTSVERVSGYLPTHNKFTSDLTAGMNNSYYKGCKNTAATTLDGTEPVETFVTNPNALKVNKAGRDISEPILEVE